MIAILLTLLVQTPSDAARAFEEGNAAYAKSENDYALAA
jgi:hypothetical protein